MAHAQKPYFVFRRNGRVHLSRRGRHFSRRLAADVNASAVVTLDTPMFRGSVKGTGLHKLLRLLLRNLWAHDSNCSCD